MNVMATPRMTVDEFLAWAERRPGKFELHGGVVQQMSPERADHVIVKASVWATLRTAVRSARLPYLVLTDGLTVRIDTGRAYVPDAVVTDATPFDGDSVEARSPIIVVEVLSPSTAAFDEGQKLIGYFSLPSVLHYLLVDPRDRAIVHHRRASSGSIETRIIKDGRLTLDPPGIGVDVASFFEDLP